MQESSQKVTADILNQRQPASLLDAPCGKGWLAERLNYHPTIDGIDLFDTPQSGYRQVLKADLDYGLPEGLPSYDCISCCEGIEHFGNPDLFLKTAKRHLNPGGWLVITTPNIWYPAARLQFFLRGFFPGFPCLVGKIQRGSHMHIMPWSYPHLYLYLKLNGFKNIQLHAEPLSKAKHFSEKILALPQRLYCKRRWKRASSQEEKEFWKVSMSGPSLYGRHLIVTAEI